MQRAPCSTTRKSVDLTRVATDAIALQATLEPGMAFSTGPCTARVRSLSKVELVAHHCREPDQDAHLRHATVHCGHGHSAGIQPLRCVPTIHFQCLSLRQVIN